VYNIACGEQTNLNEMVEILAEVTGRRPDVEYGPERPGDVKHSLADISKAKRLLSYEPTVYFREGLEKAYGYYVGKYEAESTGKESGTVG
jgi:UDP-N-acetylglucosamine/UDP-N-acetylgalactosamine 4-epimerase